MKKFQRTIEDFQCENCGKKVRGDGYTNHCPSCLWSKHVDIHPGDRQNKCDGMMKPVEAFFKQDCWFVIQECQRCGERKKIKLRKQDDLQAIEEIITKKLH